MYTHLARFRQFFHRWFGGRPILPVLALSAAAVVFVSEDSYNAMVSTVRDDMALVDSRVQSALLLQLLAEAKTAEYGFLLTGQPEFAARFDAVRQALPDAQNAVVENLTGQGHGSAASAREVSAITVREIAQVSRSFELAQTGEVAVATQRLMAATSRSELHTLR